jgi:hypothetical protein
LRGLQVELSLLWSLLEREGTKGIEGGLGRLLLRLGGTNTHCQGGEDVVGWLRRLLGGLLLLGKETVESKIVLVRRRLLGGVETKHVLLLLWLGIGEDINEGVLLLSLTGLLRSGVHCELGEHVNASGRRHLLLGCWLHE